MGHCTTFVFISETQVIDLQKVLVPTTTQIINAVPQVGPIMLERSKSPVVLELATASLDLVLPATEMKCKIQPLKTPEKESQSPISKTFPDIILEPTSQSEVQSAMANRANQLKKARESFFLGPFKDSSTKLVNDFRYLCEKFKNFIPVHFPLRHPVLNLFL